MPIVVSFECHVGVEQQKRAVVIAKEVWQDKLIAAPLDESEGAAMIRLDQARGKILLKVEYCQGLFPQLDDTVGPSASAEKADESSETDEEERAGDSDNDEDPAALATRKKRKRQPKSRLCRELAELGVYTTSLKRPSNLCLNPDL